MTDSLGLFDKLPIYTDLYVESSIFDQSHKKNGNNYYNKENLRRYKIFFQHNALRDVNKKYCFGSDKSMCQSINFRYFSNSQYNLNWYSKLDIGEHYDSLNDLVNNIMLFRKVLRYMMDGDLVKVGKLLDVLCFIVPNY